MLPWSPTASVSRIARGTTPATNSSASSPCSAVRRGRIGRCYQLGWTSYRAASALEHVAQHRIAQVRGRPDQPGADLAGHRERAGVARVHVHIDALQAEALEAEVAHGAGSLGRVAPAPARRAEAVAELDLRSYALERHQAAVSDEGAALDLDHRPQREAVIALDPHQALNPLARLVQRSGGRHAYVAPNQRVRVVGMSALDVLRLPAAEHEPLGASDFQRYSSPLPDLAATTPPRSTSATAAPAPSFALLGPRSFQLAISLASFQTTQPVSVYLRVFIDPCLPGSGWRKPSATGGSTAR